MPARLGNPLEAPRASGWRDPGRCKPCLWHCERQSKSLRRDAKFAQRQRAAPGETRPQLSGSGVAQEITGGTGRLSPALASCQSCPEATCDASMGFAYSRRRQRCEPPCYRPLLFGKEPMRLVNERGVMSIIRAGQYREAQTHTGIRLNRRQLRVWQPSETI